MSNNNTPIEERKGALKLGAKQKEAIEIMRTGATIYESFMSDPIYYSLGGKQIRRSLFESLEDKKLIKKIPNPEKRQRHHAYYELTDLGKSIKL